MIPKKTEMRLSIIFLIASISFYLWANNQRIIQLDSRINKLENIGVIR